MKHSKTQKMIYTALFAALACVATMVIHIPITITQGYINLGDCIVLLAGFMLGPVYGTIAAGIGSAFADILLSYAAYAPATFVIKALMALVAALIYRFPQKSTVRLVLAGIVAELIMVFGYFGFECILYKYASAALAVPLNSIQALAGIIVASVLIKIFSKVDAIKKQF